MANDIIDINVYETTETVSITVNPNLTTININEVTGVGGSQNLQSVTNFGNTTTNSITANSFIKSGGTGANVLLDNGNTTPLTSIVGTTNLTYTSGISNGVVNSNTGTDATIPLADGTNAGLFSATEKTKLSGIASGAEVNVNADWNAVSGDAQILNKPIIPSITGLATTTYVDNKDNSQQLQLNYLDRDNSIFDAFYLRTIADGGTVEASNQLLSSLAVLRNISYVNQGYTQQINADKFVKLGGAADEYLMADGSVSFGGGGGGGATNLTTTQTISNFTINSNTGTDATVPLGNGTLAGATLNDYTTAEKNKLAGIQAGANLGVPYTGATSDVNLGEFGIQLGNLEFDNTPTNIPTAAGSVYYNDSDGTLDLILKGGNVTLQLGQENIVRVVNKTTTNISLLQSNYQAVRITGAQGQRPKVDLAQATNDVLSAETIGLVTETIANNQEGFIITSGLIRNINTTGSLQGETWLDGDILYLSPTVAGSITKVKPIAPNHLIIIGYVIYAHITQGTIFVKVDNGYELDELHNVKIATPANNSVLAYTLATDIWENKTIATALGYTPANDASVVHLTGSETIAGTKTFSSNIVIPATGNALILSTSSGGTVSGLTTTTYPDLTELTYLKGVTSSIQTQFSGKQATLQSTVNIKSINGTSILGGGDLTISGTGISSLNGLTGATQTFSILTNFTGSPAFLSSGTNHQLRLPSAGLSTDYGLISNTTQSIAGTKEFLSNPQIPVPAGNTATCIVLGTTGGGGATGTLQIGDTTTYPNAQEIQRVKGVTSNIQTQLNGKQPTLTAGNGIDITTNTISTVDVSRNAFTVLANNTNASAVPTEQVFKNVGEQTYSGAITWGGTTPTAPSGTTDHTYMWSQVGNLVTLRINLSYSVAGSSLSSVVLALPSDLPTPETPSSVTVVNDVVNYGSGMLTGTKVVPATPTAEVCALRLKTLGTPNVFEIYIGRASAAHRYAYAFIQYFV